MDIRSAAPEDLDAVIQLYYDMIDSFAEPEHSPRWTKDVYPTREDLAGYIRSGDLFLGFVDGQLAASAAMDQTVVPGSEDIAWTVDAPDDRVYIVHLLAVLPRFAGQGRASELMRFLMETAKSRGALALRLDVVDGNYPAERLYTKLGFRSLGRYTLYYVDTGWVPFLLMEYPL